LGTILASVAAGFQFTGHEGFYFAGVNATMSNHWRQTVFGAAERVFESKSAKTRVARTRLK
jgi:hypothetical protein